MQKKNIIKLIKNLKVIAIVFLFICEIGIIVAGVKGYCDFISIYSDTFDIEIGVPILYFIPYFLLLIIIMVLMLIIKKVSDGLIMKYKNTEQNQI